MSGFSADWLALRAGADARARDRGLAARLGGHFADVGEMRVLDLGAGSGANLRATAPLIEAGQHWLLADNDAGLLARAQPIPNTSPKISIERREADLAVELPGLFDPVPDLVTASAFFDLCGMDWIGQVVSLVAASGAALYAVLTYDGREEWRPPHPLDAEILAAFHADQRRDKGLGPALGPGAHAELVSRLRDHGYLVLEATSDWELRRPGDRELIAALVEGEVAAVAGAVGAERSSQWRTARIGAQGVTIGHRDLLALPPASRRV